MTPPNPPTPQSVSSTKQELANRDDNSNAPSEMKTKTVRSHKVFSGVELIAAERTRQISVEGWTAAHDDEHNTGELLSAGIAYAVAAQNQRQHGRAADMRHVRHMYWPWNADWWKPSNSEIKNLVKAGALIAAEIDRLNRLAK